MKPPILDEDLAGVPAPGHDSSQVDPRNVAFQRIRFQSRLTADRIEPHPQTLNERIIRVIPRQSKHLLRGQHLLAATVLHNNSVAAKLFHSRLEQRLDLPSL